LFFGEFLCFKAMRGVPGNTDATPRFLVRSASACEQQWHFSRRGSLCVLAATTFLFLRWNSNFDSPLSPANASLAKPGRTGIFESKQF
jgi:hypothetical protein